MAYAEGYGTTEAGGSVTVRDRINRSEVLDYRLRDVPELGYYSTDKPYPSRRALREDAAGHPRVFQESRKRPPRCSTRTASCSTGDIMEERGPDHLVYVDRRNDVLKLAQGEFVTLGAVGTTFETHSDVIRQIFVYGSSARAYLLAVVVPDSARRRAPAGAGPSEAQVKELIRAEMARVAQEQSMRSFEVPRDFIVEPEPFSQENGLLSSVSKRLRPRLLERYGDRLEQMYDDLERRQHADLIALRDPDSGLSVLERIGRALAATLSLDEVDTGDRRSFAEVRRRLPRGRLVRGTAERHLRRRGGRQPDPQPGREPDRRGRQPSRGHLRPRPQASRPRAPCTASTPATCRPRISTSSGCTRASSS